MTFKADPDPLVISFLRHAEEHGIAALVAYGFTPPGGAPVLRVKANVPDGPAGGILKMLQGLDAKAIAAAARALFMALPIAVDIDWGDLDRDTQVKYATAAFAAISAAQEVSGKLLGTAPLEPAVPKSKIIT